MNRGDVRTGVRDLLNDPNAAGFYDDPKLNRFINRAFLEVYTEVIQSNEGFFGATVDISFVVNQQAYNLPAAGIARILFVERRDLEIPITMKPIALQEKNKWESTQITAATDAVFRYFLFGNQIFFTPTPRFSGVNNVRLYLTPTPTLPTTPTNADDAFTWPIDLTEMHHELIVWLTFIRAITTNRELVALHMPNVTRLWDLCKADNNRRQHQESMGFTISEDEA